MNPALLRERVIFDLWRRKTVPDSGNQHILEDLEKKGYVVGIDGHRQLTPKGLEFVLHGRNTADLVDLLQDIEMEQEERIFLANAIRGIINKPFAYQVIKTTRETPDRERYPSVDLGAYEDIEHGVLFGAREHIMIDPLIGQRTIDQILQKLECYCANVREVNREGDRTTHVKYRVGDAERELYLVGTEAMKVPEDIKRIVERGIFALMMKGRGGNLGDGFGNLLEAVENRIQFLVAGGVLLTGVEPKIPFKKIGEGMLAYWVHASQDYRLSQHGLYLKQTKG